MYDQVQLGFWDGAGIIGYLLLLLGVGFYFKKFSEKGIEKIKSWPLEEFGDNLLDSEDNNTKFSNYLKDMIENYRRDQDE